MQLRFAGMSDKVYVNHRPRRGELRGSASAGVRIIMVRIVSITAAFIVFTLPTAFPAYAGRVFVDAIYGVSISSNITYAFGNTTGTPIPLKLDIYRPTSIGQGVVPTLSPAVVLQDGGAWTSASKEHERVTTPATYLAQRRPRATPVVPNHRAPPTPGDRAQMFDGWAMPSLKSACDWD
jgi:hypothetical protein